jgi:hypothetical protein
MSHWAHWDDPTIWQRDRWWIVAWLVWGIACAVGIGFGDRSIAAGMTWFLASAFVAAFGQPPWAIYSQYIAERSARWFPDEFSSHTSRRTSESASPLGMLEDDNLSLLDPNRRDWHLCPTVALAVGPIHGAWAGSVVALAGYFTGDLTWSAFHSALIGGLWGVVIGIVLAGAVIFVFIGTQRGPSINALRDLVQKACAEAEMLHHDDLDPGHLLLAILHPPSGTVAELVSGHEGEIDRAWRQIVEEIQRRMSRGMNQHVNIDDESGSEDDLLDVTKVLSDATDEARRLRHGEVGSGHLLLALLDNDSELTTKALVILGVGRANLRQSILHFMPRAC